VLIEKERRKSAEPKRREMGQSSLSTLIRRGIQFAPVAVAVPPWGAGRNPVDARESRNLKISD
jgi:hypothetical protein